MAKIFICYRRDDTAGYALLLYSRLEQHFGRGKIFMDIDNIPAGANFVNVLQKELRGCVAVIVMIGRDWLAGSRIHTSSDFVRLEIVQALKNRTRIFPVLVNGVSMPSESALPDVVRPLCLLQAVDVRHASFSSDVRKLVKELEKVPGLKAVPAGGGKKQKSSAGSGTTKPTTPQTSARGSQKPRSSVPESGRTGEKPEPRSGARKSSGNGQAGTRGGAVRKGAPAAAGTKQTSSEGKGGPGRPMRAPKAASKTASGRGENAGRRSGTATPKPAGQGNKKPRSAGGKSAATRSTGTTRTPKGGQSSGGRKRTGPSPRRA